MPLRDAAGSSALGEELYHHSLLVAAVLYLLLCIPGYLWLEGSMGFVGSIPPIVPIVALASAGIVFIPAIKTKIIEPIAGK